MEKRLSGRAWDGLSEEQKRIARPWDILDPNMQKVTNKVREERIDACNNCEFLIKFTKQCKKCGCFMKVKTTIPWASCPIGKWDAVAEEPKNNQPVV